MSRIIYSKLNDPESFPEMTLELMNEYAALRAVAEDAADFLSYIEALFRLNSETYSGPATKLHTSLKNLNKTRKV